MKYGRSLRVLHKTKIPKHIPNFEDDSYLHATTFIREDYVGTLCYFLQDVLWPPPELLIDDPVAYRDQLQDAGAMAAFDSMMYGGVPQCHWQLAARSEDGEKCVKLRAFEFHKMRAWAHKPVEARVLLIALLSTEATHPMVSEVVKHLNFFSWLGRDGASVFSDKAIEMVHRFQSERAGKFTSFDHAIHHSPEIVALMHVMHALDVLENGVIEYTPAQDLMFSNSWILCFSVSASFVVRVLHVLPAGPHHLCALRPNPLCVVFFFSRPQLGHAASLIG